MDLQFRKEPISYLRTVINELQTQEQTQELRIPDGMPDIGRVIASWAQVLIRGKEWRMGGIGVNGGVMVWVLYAPEDGTEPQSVETWLPFQMKWDIDATSQDGTICATPFLQSVDARSISARKMIVRAGFGIMAHARIKGKAELGIPESLPEDVYILKNNYPMVLALESGEKPFTIEDKLELPPAMHAPEKIVYYKLCPEVTEEKLMTDKLLFRGKINVHLLYLCAQNQLHHWDTELPFSQYAELGQDFLDIANSAIQIAVTNSELEKGSDGKLTLKVGLLGQYTIYDRVEIPVVEDAYSPRRQLQLQTEPLKLPAVLDTVTEMIRPMQESDLALEDVVFYPDAPRTYRDDNGICTELSGQFYGLGSDQQGLMEGTVLRWEESRELPADADVRVELSLVSECAEPMGDKPETNMIMVARYLADRELSMVTGLELGEVREYDPERPGLILRRKGEQSLWEIAKQAGSTVEMIQKVNDITQEPEADKMLLIPVL